MKSKFEIGKIFTDLETWILDTDVHDRIYRVWYKNPNVTSGEDRSLEGVGDFMYFTEIVELPDKDLLIGMQSVDENAENGRFECLEYHKLSEIFFAYYPDDNRYDDEEAD